MNRPTDRREHRPESPRVEPRRARPVCRHEDEEELERTPIEDGFDDEEWESARRDRDEGEYESNAAGWGRE